MSAPRYAYRLGWRSLRHVAPNLSEHEARVLADALGPAFAKFGITNRRRAAMAVAQFAEETDGFRTLTEYASGAEYEGRKDLGNVIHGDGKRFKGRGFIQVTGRSNYQAVGAALKIDCLRHPEMLAEPRWAAYASAWWWSAHHLNGIADKRDITRATRVINGGLNGLATRKAYYRRALLVSQFLVPKRRKP